MKYEVQYGCQTDAYHSIEHKTARAEQAPWSQPDVLQPAQTLPWQKEWDQPGKPREAQQEESEAYQTLSMGKANPTFTATFQLGRRAAVMEQSVFCAIREWKCWA